MTAHIGLEDDIRVSFHGLKLTKKRHPHVASWSIWHFQRTPCCLPV